MASVPSIGGQRYVDRHRQRGKMLPRERIEQLVDPDTPFLELSALAGWGSEFPIGAGVGRRDRRRRRRRVRDRGDRHDLPRRVDEPALGRQEHALPRDHPSRTGCRGSTSTSRPAPTCRTRPTSSSAVARASSNQTQLSKLGIPTITAVLRTQHRRRRIHAGHERLHDLREGARHRLPRWAAAGEDGDRRGRRRGDARRRRDAQPAPAACRDYLADRRDGRAADHPRHRAAPAVAEARARARPNPPTIRSTTRTS